MMRIRIAHRPLRTSVASVCVVLPLIAAATPVCVALLLNSRVDANQDGKLVLEGSVVPCDEKSLEERPAKSAKSNDPQAFWNNRRVYQTRGIVIEDGDHVVKSRWYELDWRAVGTVCRVQPRDDKVMVTVVFENDQGWVTKIMEPPGAVQQMILELGRKSPDAETFEFIGQANGWSVNEELCGLIQETPEKKPPGDEQVDEQPREPGAAMHDLVFPVRVVFCADLLRLELPKKNDEVCRGPDWDSGYADGSSSPLADADQRRSPHIGVVVGERSRDGNVEVQWNSTGRRAAYRFDSLGGFYDVVKIAADGEEKHPAGE